MSVWLNGTLLEKPDQAIAVTDRGFALGDGLFETILARGGAPARLSAHLARLRRGAATLNLPVPYDDTTLAKALAETLAANGLEDGVLRLTLSRGPAARGLVPAGEITPTLVITASDMPPPPPPARAVIATVTRRNELSPLSRCKSLCYLDNILARQEAEAKGANEALLLNTRGRLAEATIANLFLVLEGRLLTPPVGDGALPGTLRCALLDGHEGIEFSLNPGDLSRATEGFLTNSLGVRPLLSVDGAPLGSGEIGPLTARLMQILP